MTDHIVVGDVSPRTSVVLSAAQVDVTLPFKFFSNEDVTVYIDEVLQVLTTDFSVTGAGQDTGTRKITLVTPAVGGEVCTIVRRMVIKRETDYTDSGSWTAARVNDDFDKTVMMAQENANDIDRSLRLADADSDATLTLPVAASRASRYLGFDADGNVVVGDVIGTWKGNWATATAYYVGDVVKDAAAGANTTNLYRCVVANTSGVWATDLAVPKWELIINVAAVNAARVAAELAETNAETAQAAAELAETNAETAQAAAELAETNAEAAQAAAVAAQGLSEDARDASVAAQGLSEDARDAAALSAAAALAVVGGAKISANDTTAAPLGTKLVAGTGVTLTENNDGGDETLTVECTVVAEPASPAFKNLLINGGMEINQFAPASSADDTYGLDQWNILTQTGAVAVSQVTDAENTTPYMMRVTQSQSIAQRFGFEQIVEASISKRYRGQALTLSARVRCSASTTIHYAILEWTGTADSVTSDVVADWTSGTYTAGNFFLGSDLTVTAVGSTALTANTLTTISAMTGTLGSSVNNLMVLFWTDSTQAQNVTLDAGKVQIEQGASASGFEQLPYDVVIARCQRYYINSYTASAPLPLLYFTSTVANGAIYAVIQFPQRMRTAPTVLIMPITTPTNTGRVSDMINNDLAASSGEAYAPSVFSCAIQNNSGGAITPNSGGFKCYYSANARL